MAGERTSVYLAADLAAAVKASGVPLAELVRRGLATGTAEVTPPAKDTLLTSPSPAAIPAGEPSHGVLYMGPGCFQRDTRTYGLRELPLCTVCAAALQGQAYKREISPGAARAIRRGAA
jgi:hypothetical protein